MTGTGTAEWAAFALLVAALLAIDVGYASRGERGRSLRKAWIWSGIWIGVALAFGAWIAIRLGQEAGLTYLTACPLEQSLSIDNLVVFALVFSQTGIPLRRHPDVQRRRPGGAAVGAQHLRAVHELGFAVHIESADLVFAVDSIPAVLAVTREPFLVYTSNVFALLGLRSLYAVIGNLAERFAYLRIGLAALLVFVALKLMLSGFLHIPPAISLAIIVAILGIAGAASRLLPEPSRRPAIPSCGRWKRTRTGSGATSAGRSSIEFEEIIPTYTA